ncbi:MAG: sigma-E processing peptidase SpoIIGA [Oscillospiraceae bacterium]|nr:sigma-E processing peptidase SpoIIGA [Oscillospiraceae bacterium]
MKDYVVAASVLCFFVDYFLILGTNQISGHLPDFRRSLLAAAFGALYSVLCLADFAKVGAYPWCVISVLLKAGIAFGCSLGAIKRTGIYLILKMALKGMTVLMDAGKPVPVLACVGILWLLCQFGFQDGKREQEYIPISIRYQGRQARILALRDTGNTLRDPVTGKQVLVVSAEVAAMLTGLNVQQLKNPLETLLYKPVPGIRLIPYKAVGGSGMMLGMQFSDVTIGKKQQSAVVAFAPDGFDGTQMYQALTGGAV